MFTAGGASNNRSRNPLLFLLLFWLLSSTSALRSTVHHQKRAQWAVAHLLSRSNTSTIHRKRKGSLSNEPFNANSRKSLTTRPMLPNPSVSAASGLLVSSSLGLMADRFIPNIGILVTLISSAVASNLNLLPPTHALYDLCWSLFLPASLALMLVSTDSHRSTSGANNNMQSLQLVGTCFLMGSIGSILGCLSSFSIFQKQMASAAVAAGCLCASYIGGSVNFFATSRIVGGDASLMSSMAAADLLVMAVYFVGLTACGRGNGLKKLFAGDESCTDNDAVVDHCEMKSQIEVQPAQQQLSRTATATALVTILALSIVQISNYVEAKMSAYIPGTACGIICAVTFLIKRPLSKFGQWKGMQQAAKPLSSWAFQLLFASIGISANLGQALVSGPTCLYFSLWALLVHSIVIFCASLVLRKTCLSALRLEHVLVASNAAIGGPATAAAFCGQLGIASLTIAATMWGVIGYAVGTGIGVSLTRFLLQR